MFELHFSKVSWQWRLEILEWGKVRYWCSFAKTTFRRTTALYLKIVFFFSEMAAHIDDRGGFQDQTPEMEAKGREITGLYLLLALFQCLLDLEVKNSNYLVRFGIQLGKNGFELLPPATIL